MKILALVGTLGCGKSTVAQATIGAIIEEGLVDPTRIIYILNDQPTSDGRMVDGHKVDPRVRIIPLPNTCFCCEGFATFRDILSRVTGDCDLVFLEGYGFVGGEDTRSALESGGYPYGIFTLFDTEYFPRNQEIYGEILASQLTSATLGIGMTHLPSPRSEDGGEEYLRWHIRGTIPVIPLSQEDPIPMGILRKFLGKQRPVLNVQVACCNHHHDHDHPHSESPAHSHEHHHHHHSFISVTHRLISGVSMEIIRETIEAKGSAVVRAKGIIDGVRFDFVGGKWNLGEKVDTPNIATLYGVEEENLDLPKEIIGDVPPSASNGEDTATLLQRDEGGKEEAMTAFEGLLGAIPDHPLRLSNGRIAIHPEKVQILLQIGRRPSIADEAMPRAVAQALRYWIACAKILTEDLTDETRRDLIEMALTIWWWAEKTPLPEEIMEEVSRLGIGKLLAMGTIHIECLPGEEAMAIQYAEYYLEALSFAKRLGEDSQELSQLLGNCCNMVSALSPEVIQAWNEAKNKFDVSA